MTGSETTLGRRQLVPLLTMSLQIKIVFTVSRTTPVAPVLERDMEGRQTEWITGLRRTHPDVNMSLRGPSSDGNEETPRTSEDHYPDQKETDHIFNYINH